MAQNTRNKLKSFFQVGDIPNEGNYIDVMDSFVNIKDHNSGSIILSGSFETTTNITASGNISASGTIIAEHILSSDDIVAQGNISASGTGSFGIIEILSDISASGNLYANKYHSNSYNVLRYKSSTDNVIVGNKEKPTLITGSYITLGNNDNVHITASGNISASGALIGNSLTLGGTAVTSTPTEINRLSGVLSNVKEAYDGVSYNTSTGVITFTELDNGTDTIDIRVGTNDIPTFAGLTLTKDEKGAVGSYGGSIAADGKSINFILRDIPTLPGKADGNVSKPTPTFIRNEFVDANSVILITCTTAELSATGFGNKTATAVASNGFFLSIANESATNFTTTSASFNAVII